MKPQTAPATEQAASQTREQIEHRASELKEGRLPAIEARHIIHSITVWQVCDVGSVTVMVARNKKQDSCELFLT